MNNNTYHLGCKPGDIRSNALVFGDPARCRLVYEFADQYKILSRRRGFVTGNATIGECEFTFASLGIGGPSWVIGLYELAECGAKKFIRVGTAGIISQKVKAGDLIVPTSIISDEAISGYLLPEGVSLVPDLGMADKLICAAIRKGCVVHQGEVHSKDLLYIEQSSGFPLHSKLKKRMDYLKDRETLVTEMECAALFAFGSAMKYKTAAILAAIDQDERLSKMTLRKAIDVSLELILERI